VGQKTNPKALRLGITKECESIWFAKKGVYAEFVYEDNKLRKFIKEKLYKAGISKIIISRKGRKNILIDLYAARPGVVMGRGGSDIKLLKEDLVRLTQKKVVVNVNEESNVSTNAQLLSEAVSLQLERRVAFRRAMKQVITKALKSGARGIKVMVAGRLGGAEIARTEWYREGRVPLQTFRADVDYGFAEAMTTYGKIGVKVWVYNGDVIGEKDKMTANEVTDEKNVELEEEKENVNA